MASQIGEKTGGGAQKFISSHCRPVCKWLCTDVFVLYLLLLSLPGCSDTYIASAPSPETALGVGSRCRQVWCNICLHPAPGCGAQKALCRSPAVGEVSAWHHKQLVAALGGAGGEACCTRVGAQRRKKLEPRIPAGCRERSVICSG